MRFQRDEFYRKTVPDPETDLRPYTKALVWVSIVFCVLILSVLVVAR